MAIPARIWLCSDASDVLAASKQSAPGDLLFNRATGTLSVADSSSTTIVGPVVAGTNVAALTDSTGGTPSATLAAIAAGTTYAQADMVACKNGLASIAAKFDALRTSLVNAGLIAGP